MGGMPGMNFGNQMFSPANYDPIMLQQVAPVQNYNSIQQNMPGGLMTPNGLVSKMSSAAFSGSIEAPKFQNFGSAMPMPSQSTGTEQAPPPEFNMIGGGVFRRRLY
jgi:hypothetical protein